MVHYEDYVAGWLDSSIDEFLAAFPRRSESAAFALITCLDSNPDPSSVFQKNSRLRLKLDGARPLKGGLLLPSHLLRRKVVRSQLFFGFDEIWFFPHDDIEPRPESARIVGPRRIDQAKLDRLGPWMTANGCSLALGDGEGLNIIARAHGLVKFLIAHSLSQPEPSFRMNERWVQDEEKKPTTAKPLR